MIEAGLVVGYLVAWAVRKARYVGQRLDRTSDAVLDASLDRLDKLVREKIAGHPALQELDEEAKASSAIPNESAESEVTELTRQQLALSIESAIRKDHEFSKQMIAALAQVESSDGAYVPHPPSVNQQATTRRGNIYQAGRDINGPK